MQANSNLVSDMCTYNPVQYILGKTEKNPTKLNKTEKRDICFSIFWALVYFKGRGWVLACVSMRY